VVIEDGRLVFQGSVDALLASRRAQLLACPEEAEQAEKLLAMVVGAGLDARIVHHRAGPVVEVDTDRCWAACLNRLAMDAGITLVHLAERPVSLEEAFFAITGKIAGEDVLACDEDDVS